MKTRNLLSLFAIVIAIAFASTNLFAQEEGKKENKNEGLENLENQGTADTVRTQLQNEGEETKNRVRVRVNEGQGTMTREQLDGEAKALKQATKKDNVNTFGGNKYGPGDGTGNAGIGPKDGTGNGSGTVTGSASGTKRGSRK